MARKTNLKSAEIERFKQVLGELKESPGTLEEKTGISARTINNYMWGDNPLGGQLLRVLAEQFGVSVDWLLTGRGEMFIVPKNRPNPPRHLVQFREKIDPDMFQDQLWLMARCIEESMYNAGGWPNEDYSIVDIYALAMPYALDKLKAGEVKFEANEAA